MDLLFLERGVRDVPLEDDPMTLFVAQLIDLFVLGEKEKSFSWNERVFSDHFPKIL